MRKLDKADWLLFFASAPLGCLVGATVGFLGTLAAFALTGTGHSHNDMLTLPAVTFLGGVIGLIGGPVLVWRRWRRQSLF